MQQKAKFALARLSLWQYIVVIVLSESRFARLRLYLGAPPSLGRGCRQRGRLVICEMMSPEVLVGVYDNQVKLLRAPSFAELNQKRTIGITKIDIRIWDKYVA